MATHLTDYFIELFAYVAELRKTVQEKEIPFDQVRETVIRLLARSETGVSAGSFPSEDLDHARFAVCAWVDETLLSSSWQQKHLWLREQLQRIYFGTTGAGEEFFERLSGLGQHQREVREVYYLCLALGFSGRFCRPGDERQLEQLKSANLKLLLSDAAGSSPMDQEGLFPEAHGTGGGAAGHNGPRSAFPLRTSLCLAGPLLLFMVLFLIYHFTLRGAGENLLRAVAN